MCLKFIKGKHMKILDLIQYIIFYSYDNLRSMC